MKKNMIKENLNNFYSEEDSDGKIGQVGQVKSYDCGYMTESNVEVEAKESGYQSIEEYLKAWWNEASAEMPFTWETLGNGYGYHGNDIFTQVEPDGGILHCKEIFGQIMFDVYPPQQNESKTNKNMKKNTIRLNENTLRKIVAESVKNVLSEIDWKTYANAANKRRKQYHDEIKNGIDSDKWDRAQELDNAASRAISDKFGKNLKTWGDNWNGETGDRHVMDADAPWTTGTNAMGPEPTGYYYTSSKDRDWRNGSDEYQNGDYDLYGDIPLDFKSQSEEDKQNNNIGREIDNFTHDRYAYDNEKGWHLKESVDKAVKSVLKEYINKK